MKITSELIETLLYEEESTILDFKAAQYPFRLVKEEDKSELLKDVLAFANAWRHTTAFIMIGIREIKGARNEVVGITDHLEDADVQQFVNQKTQRPVTFSYTAHEIEGKQIGIISIPVQDRPFYLKHNFGTLRANEVYIRRGTSTDIASPDEIAKMGFMAVSTHSVGSQPVLKISFVDCEGNSLDRVAVPAYATLEIEKETILNKLRDLKIGEQDIEVVKKHVKELDEIFEYLPDGSEFRPFKASRVIKFKTKIDRAIQIANENFCEIEKRLGAYNRAGLLKCGELFPGQRVAFNIELELSNDGSCPAENVVVYIDSTDCVNFFSLDELLLHDLELEFPRSILETIRTAKLSDSERHSLRLQYFQKRQNKYPFGASGLRPWEIPTLKDVLNPQPSISLNSGQLKIRIPTNLMHNHRKLFKSRKVYICASLKKGQVVEVPYTCHANNLPIPSRGVLIFQGVDKL